MTRVGVGPLAALASPRRGWGYGGIVAEGGVTPDDIAIVSKHLAGCGVLKFRVRPNPLHARLWDGFAPEMRRVQKVAHVVDLDGGPEAVRARFRPSARKGIKAAEKMGIRVETATHGRLLPEFFELAVKARAYWATRQHEPVWLAQMRGRMRDSEAKWNCIAKHLGADLQVSVAWHEDRPVAAGIVLQGRQSAHGTRAAMDPELRCMGASHFLNWAVLQNACAAGARWFHMGESATPGVEAFKEFLGARRFTFEEIELERIPFSRIDRAARWVVKKAVGVSRSDPVSEANAGSRGRLT